MNARTPSRYSTTPLSPTPKVTFSVGLGSSTVSSGTVTVISGSSTSMGSALILVFRTTECPA